MMMTVYAQAAVDESAARSAAAGMSEVKPATWIYPTLEKVIIGAPAAATIASEADRLDRKRAFVITSKSVASSDLLDSIAKSLRDRYAGLFDGIRPGKPLEDILAAAAAARAADADLILAVGGGSVIDAAKVITICLRHNITDVEGLAPFQGFGNAPDASRRPPDEDKWVRMIAIPTTLSAAEFTWWGGGTDRASGISKPYADPMGMARTIILDPVATLNTPLELFLATGIKAVDHAAERLTSVRQDTLSDARSIHCLRLLPAALKRVRENPADLTARLQCQTGMAVGMASPLTGVGVGASHAVGHALGAHSGVPHGLTSCVMLAPVMRWNEKLNADRQALISEAMGQAGRAASDVIRELVQALGLPHRLRDVGVGRADLPIIAQKVMGDHSIGGNVRRPRGPEDLMELLELAW
jgi:maleylacetate reductase